MEPNQREEMELDLRELLLVLLDKVWTVLLSGAAGAILAAVITALAMTPVYSSSSMIYIMNQGTDLSRLSVADLQVGSELTSDYMVLVTSRPVVNKVIKNLKLDMTYEKLKDSVTIANPPNTRILMLTVKNTDPYMAKTIVDELTNVAIERTAKIMDTSKPNIVEEGTVNKKPVSPGMGKNICIGALLGLLLAGGSVVVLYLFNDSVRTAEDVEKYLELHTLGSIPMEEGVSKKEERKKERKNHRRRLQQEKRVQRKGRAS